MGDKIMTTTEALLWFALIAGGFLLGGVMFSRAVPLLLTGRDVCALRSDRNPGAANVFAVCGVPLGLLCLALDMLKAYLPAALALRLLGTQPVWFALVLAAPVVGHAVGVFNGFHGGKCIAAAFGAMLALARVSPAGLALLAGLYIFFSVIVKVEPHRLRSMLVFALYGVSAAVFYSLRGEPSFALGCGMIAVTGVLRHTRRFCIAGDEKPVIPDSEF